MSNYTPVKLAFQVFEPTEKGNLSDIILIHGITSNKESWFDIGKDLSKILQRRVFALDMRNHGDSDWSEDFDWHIMAKDVIHFMDEQRIDSAILIGHSMGGIISMILALTKPEKVDSIIVEDISPVLRILTEEIIKGIASTVDLFQNSFDSLPSGMDLQSAVKCAVEEIAKNMPAELQPRPEHRDKFKRLMETLVVKKGERFVAKMNTEVIKKFLSNEEPHKDLEGLSQKPVDFVYGTISQFKVHEDKDRILELFPNAKLHAVEGATHNVHIEYPEEFLQIVLQILSKASN